jgi:hypothetical protein
MVYRKAIKFVGRTVNDAETETRESDAGVELLAQLIHRSSLASRPTIKREKS